MRVVEINSVAGKQSTGRIVSDIKKELILRGHECMIAYGEEDSPDKKGNYHIGSEFDRYIHAIKARLFDSAGFESKNATKKLIKKLEEYRPNVVHLHNIHGYYINIEMLFEYLSQNRITVVWTLHDCWSFTGHCSHFSLADCSRWKSECYDCPLKYEYPKSWIMDNSRKNFKRKRACIGNIRELSIVVPSRWLSDTVKLSFHMNRAVKVIPNGIDLSIFKKTESCFKKEYGLESKTVILGVANVWTEHKGINDFIRLSEILDDKYCIVLVGKMNKPISRNRIICIDNTNNQSKLAEIYSAVDVYANFSYGETQGLTTIESLACGTPVIVYDNTAIPEVVDDSCAIVISGLDAGSIFDAIRSAIILKPEDCIYKAQQYEYHASIARYVDMLCSF